MILQLQQAAYAQIQVYNNQTGTEDQLAQRRVDGTQAQINLDRFTAIMGMCNTQMPRDSSLIPPCASFVQAFNRHMQQLFVDEQQDIQKILLGINPR